MAEIGRRIRIFGEVQGVFYRAWTTEQAQMLGVTGFVRNRRDGSVEVEAYGEEAAVEALIESCRQGPSRARVDRVNVSDSENQAPTVFRIGQTL